MLFYVWVGFIALLFISGIIKSIIDKREYSGIAFIIWSLVFLGFTALVLNA